MAEGQPIKIVDQAPKYKTTKVENWASKFRGKENQVIEDEKELFPSLFSKSATRVENHKRDNIAGLAREFYFLEKLNGNGITPEPIIFKLSPDGQKAHLLMTKIPGESLEKTEKDTDISKLRFDEVVSAAIKCLDFVHSKDILIVDINEGTFVVDGLQETGKPITIHLVDFELAKDQAELASQEIRDQLTRWYSSRDIGVAIATTTGTFELTPENASKIELYLAAKVIAEHYLGPDYTWKPNISALSGQDQAAYNKQLELIRPQLETRVRNEVAVDYERFQEIRKRDPSIKDVIKEQWFAYEYPKQLQFRTNAAMVNITLPYQLEEKGIDASPETIAYITSILNPVVEQRPSSI